MCSIDSSDIYDNEAKSDGGGIWNYGIVSISESRIYNNTAGKGGDDIWSDANASLRFDDSFDGLAALFEEDEITPLGWFYDYPTERIEMPNSLGNLPLQLKFKIETAEPQNPEEPTDPVDPDPTEPQQPEEPVNPPSGNGGGHSGYIPPVETPDSIPAEEQPTEPALVCGEAVLDPSRSDYLAGFADGASGRNMTVTRAQAVTVIFRLLTPESLQKVYSEAGVFLDVSADDWYAAFINTLQNAGVVAGCGNGMFKPEKNLTWGEMITLFTRFTDAKPDVPIPLEHWSADAVSVAASLGWLEYHSGFNPNAEVTIAEFVDFASAVFDWATTP